MNEIKTKRIYWIDYAKFYAILLVILGHISSDSKLTLWLYSFHMPLFFFLSGVTFKPAEGKQLLFVKKQIQALLIPYMAYACLYFVWEVLHIIVLHRDIDLYKKILGIIVSLRGSEYNIGIWFLPLIFLTKLYVNYFAKFRIKVQVILIGIFAGLAFAYAHVIRVELPWGLDVVPIAGGFVWLGYQYKNWGFSKKTLELPKWMTITVSIGLLLLNIMFGKWNTLIVSGCIDMYHMTYGNIIIYILAAIIGILPVILVAKYFLDRYEVPLLLWIGQNTLHIYCLHGIVVTVLRKGLEIFGIMNVTILMQCVLSLITLSICVLTIKVSKYCFENILTSK